MIGRIRTCRLAGARMALGRHTHPGWPGSTAMARRDASQKPPKRLIVARSMAKPMISPYRVRVARWGTMLESSAAPHGGGSDARSG